MYLHSSALFFERVAERADNTQRKDVNKNFKSKILLQFYAF